MSWTDERVMLLTKLWQQGLSASQISAQLGNNISRNAVIGKIHRLGLNARNITDPKVVKVRTRNELLTIEKNSTDRMFLKTLATADATEETVAPGNVRRLVDLSSNHCRWPIGDLQSPNFRFCGAQRRDGASYCEKHFRMAYTPQRRKPARQRSTTQPDQSLTI